jgi:hypothetical protein
MVDHYLPTQDSVSGSTTTEVQRKNYELGRANLDATRQIARAQQITNRGLAEFHRTNQEILKSNQVLMYLEASTLAETKKQTAIQAQIYYEESKQTGILSEQLAEARKQSELQSKILQENQRQTETQADILKESKVQTEINQTALEHIKIQTQIALINNLEKQKQKQIKQAAFSIEEDILIIEKNESPIKQFFLCLNISNQIDIVGITAKDPDEIEDKVYLRNVLQKINSVSENAKLHLSKLELDDVKSYYSNKELFDTLTLQRVELDKLIKDRPFKKASSREDEIVNGALILPTVICLPLLILSILLNISPVAIFIFWGCLSGALMFFMYRAEESKKKNTIAPVDEIKEKYNDVCNDLTKIKGLLDQFTRDYALP